MKKKNWREKFFGGQIFFGGKIFFWRDNNFVGSFRQKQENNIFQSKIQQFSKKIQQLSHFFEQFSKKISNSVILVIH